MKDERDDHEGGNKAPFRITRRAAIGSAAALALAPAFASSGQSHPHRPSRAARTGELPWAEAERRKARPGEPHRDYRPVFTPDATTLPYKVIDGVKVFHLRAEPVVHEIAEGLTVHCWGYNGQVPGPTIEAVEGDRVRIYVTNALPAPTTVHWHGLLVPNGMDGVGGMTQRNIQPGETFRYEFMLPNEGTFMYHPHFDGMTQMGLGMTGMFIIHPRNPQEPPPDRDFAIILHEWSIPGGTARPNPNEMAEFNVLTMNGRAFPDTRPLVARTGDRVRIRIVNLSPMTHHPIHLHGHFFWVTATDGAVIPHSARWPETTVLVHVGSSRNIEFIADNPGDWPIHCHMTHHMMNQMGHGTPNMIGVDMSGVDEKIRRLLPGYHTMGQNGMGEMATMKMPVPGNSIPMRGLDAQFGPTIFGGMTNVLKVRDHQVGYDDPGWYQFPEGTIASPASRRELERDGISVKSEE